MDSDYKDLFGNKYWDIYCGFAVASTGELITKRPKQMAAEVPAPSFISACQLVFMGDDLYDPLHNSYDNMMLYPTMKGSNG